MVPLEPLCGQSPKTGGRVRFCVAFAPLVHLELIERRPAAVNEEKTGGVSVQPKIPYCLSNSREVGMSVIVEQDDRIPGERRSPGVVLADGRLPLVRGVYEEQIHRCCMWIRPGFARPIHKRDALADTPWHEAEVALSDVLYDRVVGDHTPVVLRERQGDCCPRPRGAELDDFAPPISDRQQRR